MSPEHVLDKRMMYMQIYNLKHCYECIMKDNMIFRRNTRPVWSIGRMLFCPYERRLNHRNVIVECIEGGGI